LWIVGGTQWQTAEKARQIIRQHFFPIEASVHLVKDSRELSNIEGDGVIATSYPTAYPARHVQNVAQRFYLVQDFEPSFFPMGSEYLLAEETYRFGFTCITAGVWLQRLLRDNYGVEAYNFPLACDHDIYFPDAAQRRSPNRVAVYARHTTPRRAVEIAVLALEIASRNRSDLVADLFGMSVRTAYGKFNYVDHGVLAPKQLAKLYRSACVGMALSCTNYSLVPMEMMACGCPVMDLRLPSVQAVFSDDLVALADPDPKSIADRLIQLMASENDRERQSCRALTYARSLSWEESARNVEQAFMSSVRDSSNASPGAL
jgi:glycosyltransferase involved in cell wall biosynthesis